MSRRVFSMVCGVRAAEVSSSARSRPWSRSKSMLSLELCGSIISECRN